MFERRQQWWVDHVNNAPTGEEMLTRTLRWMKAERKKCKERRPGHADGFDAHLAHAIADVLQQMPTHRPATTALQPVPGGGWTPSPQAGPASNVVNP